MVAILKSAFKIFVLAMIILKVLSWIPCDAADHKKADDWPDVSKKIVMKIRKDFAIDLEQKLLWRGMDAHVTLNGEKNTILTIEYKEMSRPFAYQIMASRDNLPERLNGLGFHRVFFTRNKKAICVYDAIESKWISGM